MFGEPLWVDNQKSTYEASRATNPNFDAGAKYLAVSLAERAFVYRLLPNGTFQDLADKQNILPFFMNETFPDKWFRRASQYDVDNLGLDIVSLYTAFPFAIGINEGLNNFSPLSPDLETTPAGIMCFILTNIFDTIPGQLQPSLASSLGTYMTFANAVIAPFFSSYDCPIGTYAAASSSAGTTSKGSKSASGSPVDGVYP
jgi:Peroxidase, family 2